jgi:sugar lactone lactonase YvrE
MRQLPVLGLLGSLLFLAACGDDSTSECPEGGGSGTLQITVTGLPDPAAARVEVQAPSLTRTQEGAGESSWSQGNVTIVPQIVATSHPLVRTAYKGTASSSPACVREGKRTEVTVAYAPIPSSAKLWTSNGSGGTAPLLGFSVDVLGASGSPPATVAASTGGADGSAFDREGNLWVVGGTTADPPVLRLPAASLGASGPKTADITLKGGPLEGGFPRARALAFDPSGNLWVSVGFNDKIVRYTPAQISTSGNPTPGVELTGLNGPIGLAFDAAGNLWVAFSGSDRVARYNASRLAASSTSAPDLVIEARTPPPVIGTLGSPLGLAFDGSGNLWVNFNGTLTRLTPADQQGSGTQILTPTVQIGTTVTSLPEGLVFDESGNLWFALRTGEFGRLGPGQLTSSGDKTPEVIIHSPDTGYAGWLSLYPAPAKLPLYHRLP